MAVPKKYEHIDFKPPQSVANAAERGLEYRRRSGKGGLSSQEAGKQGIGSGVQRAVNLKNRNNIAPETFSMMSGFFSRHEKNKKINPENKDTPWEDAGHVAWLLWGGDPGKKWVDKIKKQMADADEKEKKEKEEAKKKKASFKRVAKLWVSARKSWSKTDIAKKTQELMKGNSKKDFIDAVSSASGIKKSILNEVHERGARAWQKSHTPGVTQVAWARARVYSFVSGGQTQKTTDNDLWREHTGEKKEDKKKKASVSRVARMYLADLNPGLGRSDSPCDLMRRIDQEVQNPRKKEELLELVEDGHDLKNSEAHIIYDSILESGYGKSKFKRIEITPHAQYRMDLRGVDVKELNSALFEFQKVVQRDLSQKGWSRWEDQLENYKVSYVDSTGLKVVFEPLFHRDIPDFRNLMGAVVVTAFYKDQYPKQLTRTDCGI